jgi:type II secretory pathway component PulJ
MAKDWLEVLALKGALWKIPGEEIAAFADLEAGARAALDTAQTEETRTHVSTARCGEAFDALAAASRDMKRRYFLKPPLLDSDFVSLKLKVRGAPVAQVRANTFLTGRHEIGIALFYENGRADDLANKGYRVFYHVLDRSEAPPTDPEELRKSFYTKRRKDVLRFDPKDSGMIVYIAVQVENEGRKGPWGPITAALIP